MVNRGGWAEVAGEVADVVDDATAVRNGEGNEGEAIGFLVVSPAAFMEKEKG